jgi:hypothetical protein
MARDNAFRFSVCSAGAAALVLSLGCSGGDLTLPGANEPAALMIVSGDGQRADAGTLLEEPLTGQVLDGSSQPVRGTPVLFNFLGDLPGAALDPSSVLTDENGRAAAMVRLGDVPGEQVIVAQVTNSQTPDLRARFSATAVSPNGNGGGKKAGDAAQSGGSEGDGG